MLRIEVVAPLDSVEALSSVLANQAAAASAQVSEPQPYRPSLNERVPLGHVELVQVFVEFGVGVGAAAAYDLIKKALNGLPVHRIREEGRAPEDQRDEE
ncbi:MAG TPA: hypothetical protein VGI24_03900 [Solirubrobacteraceae bacterium]